MASNEIKKRIKNLNLNIRKFPEELYGTKRKITKNPLDGAIKQSIGPWPEYILTGTKCARSEGGCCSPCGYSNNGYPSNITQKELHKIHKSMGQQATSIIDNYVETLLKKQHSLQTDAKAVQFVLATTGSFFSDVELPFEYKIDILQKLKELKENTGLNLKLYTEVRPEDVLCYENNKNLEKMSDVLRFLKCTVILGFEDVDDFVRNYVYFKNLSLEDFNDAVEILKSYELNVGAFVFVGAHSLSQREVTNHFGASISYLYERDIMPVVMISNTKEFTFDHLLYEFNRHKPIEPRTVLDLLGILRNHETPIKGEPWLIADPVGGPPEPVHHPFNNDGMVTCPECAYTILSGIRYLRKTYDWVGFDAIINPEVEECSCSRNYDGLIDSERGYEKQTISSRMRDNLKFAESHLNEYRWEIKKNHDGEP